MNTDWLVNSWVQASEEERLKLLNGCCISGNNFISARGTCSSEFIADAFVSIMLINRIEKLEEELTKNGIDIPEWPTFEEMMGNDG